jgi:hypothetical protein
VKFVQTNNRASHSTANILLLLERVYAPFVSVILGGAVVRETLKRGIISGVRIGRPKSVLFAKRTGGGLMAVRTGAQT